MEFNEKLQNLRKEKGLTQEELAEILFVSRTAVSKWESGRGYPSIDSLKDIAKYFSVSIDDLLSGENILSIAENENKSNFRKMCDLLLGVVDLFSFVLIFLPLYPNTVDGYVYSVSLYDYTEVSLSNRVICWLSIILLIIFGILKIVFSKFSLAKGGRLVTVLSVIVNILFVLFLGLARQAYAVVVAFLLLITKGLILLKHTNGRQSGKDDPKN